VNRSRYRVPAVFPLLRGATATNFAPHAQGRYPGL
jgi:hypothetical protein